jgi:hypothetical protein
MNKFEIWKKLKKIRIWTNLKFEQILDLKKCLNNFDFEQIWNLNKFRI